MNAALRALLFILAGGCTFGALTVVWAVDQGAALLVAMIVGAVAAIVGPPALRFALGMWDS